MADIITFTITGKSPLLVHNEQLANPMHQGVVEIKKISAKRKKTDKDLLDMSRLEWIHGLYYKQKLGPVIPDRCLLAMIKESAKQTKRGKDVERTVEIVDSDHPIQYKGPRDLESMWNESNGKFIDRRMVKVGTSKILRTRPKFTEWELTFKVGYDSAVMNREDVIGIVRLAGSRIGLCDARTLKYGRFEVASAEDGQ